MWGGRRLRLVFTLHECGFAENTAVPVNWVSGVRFQEKRREAVR
jgi:hypothetical protein